MINRIIKAAFFDIDGTLVSFSSHQVPSSAVRAISRLQNAGVKCFISSGRHISNIDNLGDLKFDGYVTVNGGMTFFNGRLIDSNPICHSDVATMISMISPGGDYDGMAVSFVLKDGLVMNVQNEKTDAVFRQLKFNIMPRMVDPLSIGEQDVFQLISFFSPDLEPSILSRLPFCESQRWSPVFTDVVPSGQSKVRGMAKICDYLNITPDELIAFGDGGNDVAMLRFAGLGVAMGNADQCVKNQADLVCPSVDEDGIDWTVSQLVL